MAGKKVFAEALVARAQLVAGAARDAAKATARVRVRPASVFLVFFIFLFGGWLRFEYRG
jgi:hypothetical protein